MRTNAFLKFRYAVCAVLLSACLAALGIAPASASVIAGERPQNVEITETTVDKTEDVGAAENADPDTSIAAVAESGVAIPDDYMLDYSASEFTAVPDDWELYDGCDKTKSSVTFEDGDMCIRDGGSGAAANYYGSLYTIAKDREYTDFVFEMTFKYNWYVDTSRFFSVMFHTAENSNGRLIGYYVNYRVNGGSAVSAYDGAGAHDTGSVNRNITLDDNAYHTFAMSLSGTTAKTYMDGVLLTTWNITNKDSFLEGGIESGGFALMINRSEMAVKSVKIYKSHDYYINGFNALPTDWAPLAKSHVNDSTTRYENGEMIITDTAGANAASYWGSVYRIATDMTYTNFEFEMEFRVLSYANVNRFIAVMLRTEMLSGGGMSAYYVNHRIDGRLTPCANNNGSSRDGTTTVNKGIRVDDGEKHTIKIVAVGTEITNYVDGLEIMSWDLSEFDDKIPTTAESGGFAVMVNQASLAISSVSIKSVPYDDFIVNANYDMRGGLVNGPTVVCDVEDEGTLTSALEASVKPSNAILRYNDDGNIVGANGEVIGEFYSVYKRLRGKIIPVVKIETTAAADKFIEFMTEKYKILDLSIASENAEVLKKLRLALPWTRGILYFDGVSDPQTVVATVHESRATVALIPQSAATLENVTYIQARFETVWVIADSYASADIYDCVGSGAYGIVSRHFADVYDVLATYTEKSIPRTSMNVAHRGSSVAAYENSLSAVRIAVENGATHLELDGKLTTDNQIVIIHDDAVKNTTTYDGNKTAEQMTLAEAQSYDLQLRTSPKSYLKDEQGNNIIEHLPSLQEVLDEIKNTDVILVFEVKTNNTAIIPVLKKVVEDRDMLDRLVIISFDDSGDMIDTVNKYLPTTPVAKLEGLGGSTWGMDTIADVLEYLGTGNAVMDKQYTTAGATTVFNRYLRDRGHVGWYWTFADGAAIIQGENYGYLGITNNTAEYYASRTKSVKGAAQTAASLKVGDTVNLEVTDYSGNTSQKEGKVFWCKRTTTGWRVVASYKTDIGLLYTMVFDITKSA